MMLAMIPSLVIPISLLAVMTVCLGVMGYLVAREVARRVRRPH
jgi:hypothetical protein